MARLLTLVAPPEEDALAVRVLFFAARELPLEACRELVVRLTDWLLVAGGPDSPDLSPRAKTGRRMVAAVRSVAETVGRAPTTTEYVREYERRKAAGLPPLPSVSAIVKHFGRWPEALAAAALVPPAAEEQPTRSATRLRVGRYSTRRLLDALAACRAETGYVPTVRSYAAWREWKLGGSSGRRAPVSDIPHFRTIVARFGTWNKAIEASGWSTDRESRSQEQRYSAL